jgi:hypothetical protein
LLPGQEELQVQPGANLGAPRGMERAEAHVVLGGDRGRGQCSSGGGTHETARERWLTHRMGSCPSGGGSLILLQRDRHPTGRDCTLVEATGSYGTNRQLLSCLLGGSERGPTSSSLWGCLQGGMQM